MSDLLTQHGNTFILGTECRHPFHKGHPKPDQVLLLHHLSQMPGWSCSPSGQKAVRLARSPQPTAGCRLGSCRDHYTAGVSAEAGKWPWFVSPCGQMKLLVRASTWHFVLVTILPFQGADRVPFRIQAACGEHSECTRTCISNGKWKCLSHHFIRCWIRPNLFFFMPIIICLEGAGAALRMRREDAWLSCANGEGLWLDRAGGRAVLGPAETDAPWQNIFCLFRSKVLPHSTINVCALGWTRKTRQEKNKGFDWLGGLFGKDTTFL